MSTRPVVTGKSVERLLLGHTIKMLLLADLFCRFQIICTALRTRIGIPLFEFGTKFWVSVDRLRQGFSTLRRNARVLMQVHGVSEYVSLNGNRRKSKPYVSFERGLATRPRMKEVGRLGSKLLLGMFAWIQTR
eukprot:4403368-Amphidinium_carterae.4